MTTRSVLLNAVACVILSAGAASPIFAFPQTADNAKNNRTDLQTMQQIRKAVVADKSLSTSAHNVKIISQNGQVTLKGQVQSEEEKKSVEQKAADVAGAGNVIDDITIKPAK